MPVHHPEISGSIIVLLGNFNPKIFQPEWFARQRLISNAEAEAADIKIILPQISHFETDRFGIQVTTDRFIALTPPSASPAPLRDLVQGTFFVLEHTPVTAMGLNRQMHFPTESQAQWHKLGDKLAPKDGWKGVMPGRPGLLSMWVQTDNDKLPGALFRTKVEPSTIVQNGVYFETNEHYPAPQADPLKALMKILNDRWEESHAYAEQIADHILSWATAEN
jgi:hypothetical protein